MVKNMVTKSEFARLCRVSPASITKACSKRLKKAVRGKRIDVNHPDAQAYLSLHPPAEPTPPPPPPPPPEEAPKVDGRTNPTHVAGQASAKEARKRKEPEPSTLDIEDDGVTHGPPRCVEIPENIQHLADMTLREIASCPKTSTEPALVDYLSALQKVELITEKRLKNAQTEGLLVSKELVRKVVVGRVEGLWVQLLTDGAKSLSTRAVAMAKSGSTAQEVEVYFSAAMGKYIKPIKARIAKALRDA